MRADLLFEVFFPDHADDLRDMMRRIRGLLHAYRRAARRGRLSPQVKAKMQTILDEAITKIEALADDRD